MWLSDFFLSGLKISYRNKGQAYFFYTISALVKISEYIRAGLLEP